MFAGKIEGDERRAITLRRGAQEYSFTDDRRLAKRFCQSNHLNSFQIIGVGVLKQVSG